MDAHYRCHAESLSTEKASTHIHDTCARKGIRWILTKEAG